MNAKQYLAGLQLATDAALRGNQMSLPEIMGCLNLMAIQVERKAFTHAQVMNARAVMEPPAPGTGPNGN